MAIWGQTVRWRGPAYLTNWGPVRLLFHPLDPGYYAVFARFMVGASGGPAMYEHAALAKLKLGSETDQDYARLVSETPSGEDAVKKSTPLTLMTVAEARENGEAAIDVIVHGRGAVVVSLVLNIISLDEIRDPGQYEGSFPLGAEADESIHIRDYSRDIFVPVSGAQTEVEGGASGQS